MKKLLSLLLACMVLFAFAGCEKTEPTEAQQTSGSNETQKTEIDYENLPTISELREMNEDEIKDICNFVLKMDCNEAAKRIESAYRAAIDDIENLELKSVEITEDNLSLKNGERPVGNLIVTVNCMGSFPENKDENTIEEYTQKWINSLLPVELENAVVNLKMNEVTYNFEDQKTAQNYSQTFEIVSEDNSAFGVKASVSDEEQTAIDIAMKFVNNFDEEATIKKFGKRDDGIFFIQILSNNTFDNAESLSQELLSDLKADESAWSYIEEQDCSSMEIDFSGRDTVTLEIS